MDDQVRKTVVPISVVVPTVARPDELARCLDALVDGDVLPSEVVVVDPSGDEGMAAVLAEASSRGLEVVHLRSPLRGLSAARNTGLRHVSSPWVAFTDDDCVPTRTWLSAIHARIQAPDAPDGVGGRVLPFGEAAPGTYPLSMRVSTVPAVHRGRALPWAVGTGGNMALRVPMLRAVGGYDERLGAGTPGLAGEDLEIIHRLLRAGAVLAFDPAVVVEHGRVTAERRLATRRTYGFGMGAFVGMWLRSDPRILTALVAWLVTRLVSLAQALKARDRWRLREERLLVAGLLAGLRYGWQLRSPAPPETTSPAPGGGEGAVEVSEL